MEIKQHTSKQSVGERRNQKGNQKISWGNSLVVHWLQLHAFTAEGPGSIPGWGAKILYALRPKNQNIRQKQYCNKFSKDFKNGPHQKKSLKNFQWSEQIIKWQISMLTC